MEKIAVILGILIIGVIITIIILGIKSLNSFFRSRSYTESINRRKAEEAAWIAAQPPYTPKGGILELGTKLRIDSKNPVNHGKSAITNEMWVSDVLHSTAENNDLYILSWNSWEVIDWTAQPAIWGNVVRKGSPQTAEQIFAWLEIIDGTTAQQPCECGCIREV